MKWRGGFDLGANSLGWVVVELDEDDVATRIVSAGSRIFIDGRDPKSGASLAVDRREARAMRRRRDRFKQRQQALLKYLILDGLFPTDPVARKALEPFDPFELRTRALDEKLPLHHIGRALFHLNQRRGFKSNRKADRKADDDAGKVALGIDRLRDAIAENGARTFGEFLHMGRAAAESQNAIPSVRTRLRPETGEDAKGDGYDFYPGRALIEEEFMAIWEAQVPHYPDALTPEIHARLFEIVFHQRPLKAPQIGKCTLISTEQRLPKAHPLFQRRRLLEELNALMIVRPGEKAERLTPEQRDLSLLKLKDKGKVSFASLRKMLKLDPDSRFNKESENRSDLKGDEVAALMGAKTRFATRWVHLAPDVQWEILERLDAVESDAEGAAFRTWLESEYGLSPEQSKSIVGAHLPQGYGRFGMTATTRLIDALRDEVNEDGRVIVYSEAVQRAGLGHHSDFRTREVHDELPYYGVALERHIMPGTGEPSDPEEMRIGRITNPTVHIGLNQLRRIVNQLIKAHGPPAEIAIELARELKLTDDDKKRLNRENNENRAAAARRSEKLHAIGQPDSGANRALLKLWEELNLANALDRRCIYTGQQISIDMLFSGAVDVDHILPFGATLDDGNGNKIVCMREANRFKRKRSPYEAWGQSPIWEEIAARAAQLPRGKRWRFEPDAMERFKADEGFLSRHLVDTQYLSRLAREYLASLYPDRGDGSGHVWVSPGRLTEMVRRKLGLNDLLPDHNFGGGADQPKNRLDHRHHAIDAAVVAIVDRSLLQKIARASGQEGQDGRERIIVPEPWDGFRDDLRAAVNAITVSHRTDHGTASKAGLPKGKDATAGRLHNDTAYGFTGEVDAKGLPIVVRRKSIDALKPADIANVRDVELRAALYQATEGKDGNAFTATLNAFPEMGWHKFPGVRRVRVTEPLKIIPIRDANGRAYKGYKGDSNFSYDIWEMPDGKWRAAVLSMFDAHQPGERERPHPAAKRIMRLHRDDILAIERDVGERELVRVVKFSEKQFAVAPLNEGGALKARDADKDDPFNYAYPSPNTLKSLRARKVGVDEIGRIRDPGFPMRTAVRRTRPSSPTAA